MSAYIKLISAGPEISVARGETKTWGPNCKLCGDDAQSSTAASTKRRRGND